MRSRTRTLVLVALVLAPGARGEGLEWSGRAKAFGSRQFLPADDVLRARVGTPLDLATLDLRVEAERRGRGLEGAIAWELRSEYGDAVEAGGVGGVGLSSGEDERAFGLTMRLDDGERHRVEQRLDRLWLAFEGAGFKVTVGRQAFSIGNGVVFQPVDFFNPFSPTETDTDFKRGEDMVVAQRPFAGGSEMTALAVARRDADGEIAAAASSFGLGYRSFLGTVSVEGLAALHANAPTLALGASGPLGGAVWRFDAVAAHDGGAWHLSGVANLDWSTTLAGRNVYLFAELYRNGFGVDALPATPAALPEALLERLRRGEVFTLGESWSALGGRLEWHPLWNQELLVLTELQDGSVLVQTSLTWEPGGSHLWRLSATAPLGERGEELGRIPLGGGRTAGGGERVQLRYSFYF